MIFTPVDGHPQDRVFHSSAFGLHLDHVLRSKKKNPYLRSSLPNFRFSGLQNKRSHKIGEIKFIFSKSISKRRKTNTPVYFLDKGPRSQFQEWPFRVHCSRWKFTPKSSTHFFFVVKAAMLPPKYNTGRTSANMR